MANVFDFLHMLIPFSFLLTGRRYFKSPPSDKSVLIIQCENGDERASLIACARHLCEESRFAHLLDLSCGPEDFSPSTVHIIFVVQLRRISGGCKQLGGFHGRNWLSVHIDELRSPTEEMPSLIAFADKPISSLFSMDTGASHAQLALPIGFLKRCVQPAVAELNQKERVRNSERVIKRIRGMLQLLSESMYGSFTVCIFQCFSLGCFCCSCFISVPIFI